MKKGFSFKGIHSNSMGVSVKTQSRPILPEAKRITFEPSAGDGVRDLSTYNSRGRVLYNERQFTINMHIKADNITDLQYKLTRVASWLSGTGELIFDDLPAVIWKASMLAALDYAPERAGKQAIISISFLAEPFAYAPFNALGGIPIGTKIPIGAKIPIGFPETLTYSVSGETTIEVVNIGTAPTRPIITINNPVGTYTVEIGGVSIKAGLSNNVLSDALIINCENYTVTAVNSPNGLRPVYTGTFPELIAGKNKIVLIGGSWYGIKTVTVDYLPRFLYGWEV